MSDEPNERYDGRGALRGAVPPVDPPSALEARVRSSLGARGLIRESSSRRAGWMGRVGLLAAGVAVGVFGYAAWGSNQARPAAQPGQYVLLLFGEIQGDPGAVHAAREREYGQWASSLANGARGVGGHELGEVVDDVGPKPDGTAAIDRLAGYFVIDARSREQASEVARSCPHLKYGGRVLVMAIAS